MSKFKGEKIYVLIPTDGITNEQINRSTSIVSSLKTVTISAVDYYVIETTENFVKNSHIYDGLIWYDQDGIKVAIA